MNHNRKRRETEARERRRREQALKNAAVVDASAFSPTYWCFPPDFIQRGYYLDVPFTCASCGAEEVWTAAQQKWWYEVAGGSVHSTAKLCRPCRRDARQHKGKADPLGYHHRWLLAIRDALQPDLLADGWRIVAGGEPSPSLLSYIRDDVLIRFQFECDLRLQRRVGRDGSFEDRARTRGGRYFWDGVPAEMRRRLDAFLADARSELGLAPAQSRDGATT